VGFLQNHDQVGNRAKGERISQSMSLGRLKIGAALVLCSPFVPLLFQGEEFGASAPFAYFTHHSDPDLASAVTEGRRAEFAAFGWRPEEIPDPQALETFSRAKLNWDEIDHEPHKTLLDWYRRLIALRKGTPDLADGDLSGVEVQFDDSQQWLTLTRRSVAVACNLAGDGQSVPLPFDGTLLLASDHHIRLNGTIAELPPESVVITVNR
jgi:maltooligosyltrehalose trehalohydrolase